jgi:hypothetical protein
MMRKMSNLRLAGRVCVLIWAALVGFPSFQAYAEPVDGDPGPTCFNQCACTYNYQRPETYCAEYWKTCTYRKNHLGANTAGGTYSGSAPNLKVTAKLGEQSTRAGNVSQGISIKLEEKNLSVTTDGAPLTGTATGIVGEAHGFGFGTAAAAITAVPVNQTETVQVPSVAGGLIPVASEQTRGWTLQFNPGGYTAADVNVFCRFVPQSITP